MNMVEIDPQVPTYMVDILFDPQTSGGLLISVPGSQIVVHLTEARQVYFTLLMVQYVVAVSGGIYRIVVTPIWHTRT